MEAGAELMHTLESRAITFGYGKRTVLHAVSLTVRQGEIVSVLGPNGCGKTTLLKILLGLLKPQSGSVYVNGRPATAMTPKVLARSIAYVPQIHRTPFAFKVIDVVAMGRVTHSGLFGRITKNDEECAHNALDQLNIAHLAQSSYTEISGGERQLTLIARALAQGARTLILDEPLNGLDFGNQIHVLNQITRLAKAGFTFVKTTHFPDHALWMASRVVLMRSGRVIADGEPAAVLHSRVVSDLYQADIALIDVGDGVRTCLPHSVLKDRPVPELHAVRLLCAG